jgi:hypothetical protein
MIPDMHPMMAFTNRRRNRIDYRSMSPVHMVPTPPLLAVAHDMSHVRVHLFAPAALDITSTLSVNRARHFEHI